VPVGISMAAVFVAARATGSRILWTAVLLGLAIPLAAGLTLALPVPGDRALGFLTGVAGGVLAYVGAAHLLPEAQSEHPSRGIGVLFAVTLVITAVGLMLIPHG
jgi:zinc transporter ZupT